MLKRVQHDEGKKVLVFRDAIEGDLPAIVALLADDVNGAGREDASLPLHPGYLAAFRAIGGEPNHRLIVAELDGEVVGTMQLAFLPGLSWKGQWRALIEAVRVAGDRRGEGIGARMIEYAIDQARAKGCNMIQLTSMTNRERAHAFYERLGFVKTHVGMKRKL